MPETKELYATSVTESGIWRKNSHNSASLTIIFPGLERKIFWWKLCGRSLIAIVRKLARAKIRWRHLSNHRPTSPDTLRKANALNYLNLSLMPCSSVCVFLDSLLFLFQCLFTAVFMGSTDLSGANPGFFWGGSAPLKKWCNWLVR